MANETYPSPTKNEETPTICAALLLRGAYFGALKLALETALSKPRLGTNRKSPNAIEKRLNWA